ncbi:MAG: CDP-alcohol phosphatidyltransferase family protein [Pseudomonadota bacterium]
MPERRPIASRDTKIAARVAQWLVARGVSPNRISQASVVFAALAGLAFWQSSLADGLAQSLWLIAAALGCQLRLLCNLFDGMVAVEGGKGSPDGPFWNEAPDRLADVLILVGLGFGSGAVVLGWVAATLAVSTAYIRELRSAQGLDTDFSGPMAKPHRMAMTTLAAVLAAIVPVMAGWPVLTIALWIIVLGTGVTVLRRSFALISALNATGQRRD